MTGKLLLAILVAAGLLGALILPPTGLAQPPAENTAINKRDRSSDEMTAEQQGGSKEDRELTRQIRQAVVKEESLSTNAHNLKIITVNGIVTLKGPVNSAQEKEAVEKLAAGIAGQGQVKSEIDIVGDQTSQ